MAKQETIAKVKEMLEGHCYAPLREAAEKWLEQAEDKVDETVDKVLESEFVAQLKDGVCSVEDMVGFLGSKEAVEKFGKEIQEKFFAHAKELKEAGAKFCDCPACQKAREILEDLGEKLD